MTKNILAGKKVVVFDFDGTLADTLPMNYQLDMEVLSAFGVTLTPAQYHEQGGLTYTDLYAYFVSTFHLNADPQELMRKRQELYLRDFVPQVKFFEHVIELLDRLKANGVRMAIASASSQDVFDRFFETHPELQKYFEVVVTCDELKVNKPTPVVYQECLRRLGEDVADAIIFEDTYAGLVGARQVGCSLVCFLSEPDKESEKRRLADLTIRNYAELVV